MPSEVSTVSGDRSVKDLERELAEAREQQAATAEILRVISSSPMDLSRVFAEIATSATRLCDAYNAAIFRVEGDLLRLVAHHGPIFTPSSIALTREVSVGRSVLDRRTIHIANLQTETEEYPEGSDRAQRDGVRTVLNVPLIRAGKTIGVILIRRAEVRLFSDKQIALLETFANQAVIAIENTRLFEAAQKRTKELQESLEYQTATSDVLEVISTSPNDVKPVLEAIAVTSGRLCQADDAHIFLLSDGKYRLAAVNNPDMEWVRVLYDNPLTVDTPGSVTARAIREKGVVHIEDTQADPEHAEGLLSRQPRRTVISVPLLRESRVVGAITLNRRTVSPFTPRQAALLETFADQAVIAIENTRLFEEVQEKNRALTDANAQLAEALEQQTATADVLKVISRSALDLQRVLDALVESAARLCNAYDAAILQVFGDGLRLVAHHGQIPTPGPVGQATIPLARGLIAGRAVLERRTIQIADIQAEADEYPESLRLALQLGYRTVLCVPLVHAGEAIGAILIRRAEVRPFTERHIELVNTFADQAVIAIENTRLFEEVQARSKELRESLEYQTATADVLAVISKSPNEVQPVFESIAETAMRLCQADRALICRRQGDGFRAVALAGDMNDELRTALRSWTFPADDRSVAGRVALASTTVHLHDAWKDASNAVAPPSARETRRTMLGVPLLIDALVQGVIILSRYQVKPFTERQIDLVETFADQAIIAIENTRLFEAEQASKRELQESLEYQTATSEVLGVISRSPSELQPVLDTIVRTAAHICKAQLADIAIVENSQIQIRASFGEIRGGPMGQVVTVDRSTVMGRAVLDALPVHAVDMQSAGDDFRTGREMAVKYGHRAILGVPLVREGRAIGALLLRRNRAAPFSQQQITLLQTFADQAVIAIENTRLFEAEQAGKRELARSVEELESLAKVSQAVNSSLELDKVLPTILEHACAMSYAGGGTVYVFDKTTSEFRLAAAHNMSDEHIAMVRAQPMRLNSVVVGECATRREVVQVADLSSAAPSPLLDILLRTGVRAVLAVPLLHQSEVVGVLVVRRNQPGTFSLEVIRLVEAFAAQSAIAVENARLFGEIAQKSRELEIASQHKSQFVANMSHELRTPLAAILGYAELMQEGFYEPLGQKSLDALTRIRSNGKHLLGLINTVLDIAKIESGQFTLNMSEYAIESVVETVRSATESLAQNKKLTLKTEVAKSLPIGLGDEQRITQVLLNLVGNAIKFTDTGEVCVTAKAVNGHFNISVTDTGPGIPSEHQSRIFDQFHQVDSSNTKAKGGTGLGLAIAKQIIEMHGGRIWVESTLGQGSTFQMELPTRAELRKPAP